MNYLKNQFFTHKLDRDTIKSE